MPSPPASETAATSSGVVGPPAIPAWIMGRSMPSSRHSGVYSGSLYRFKQIPPFPIH
ncbi:hypothetical protein [Paenibacillus sp. GCM10012303]|uniref:hypothetical protein n=1 Tax=Paenibacillus sp. GCM10012303 TaxID=3317340 RepID=UPI0036102696